MISRLTKTQFQFAKLKNKLDYAIVRLPLKMFNSLGKTVKDLTDLHAKDLTVG